MAKIQNYEIDDREVLEYLMNFMLNPFFHLIILIKHFKLYKGTWKYILKNENN